MCFIWWLCSLKKQILFLDFQQKRVVKMSKRKHAQIFGYTFNSALMTIRNINRHGLKGDWRPKRVVHVLCKKANITYKCKGNELPYTIHTVPAGTTRILKKTQIVAGWNLESVFEAAHDHFWLTKANFKPINFDVCVSNSGKCALFIILLYC